MNAFAKYKKFFVLAVALLSLACLAIGYIDLFVYITDAGIGLKFDLFDIDSILHFAEWLFRPQEIFSQIIPMILTYLPVVLLILYCLLFMGKKAERFGAPFVLIAVTANPALCLIRYLICEFLGTPVFGTYYSLSPFYFVIYFLTVAVFTLGALVSFHNTLRKIAFIVAPAIGILIELLMFTEFFKYLERYWDNGMYNYIITWPLETLGQILFYIALILAGLLSFIPQVKPIAPDGSAANLDNLPADEALKALEIQRQKGLLTPEEYKAKRQEIINKI